MDVSDNLTSKYSRFSITSSGMLINDNMNSKGLKYNADYSTAGLVDDRWIPDLAAVRSEIHDSIDNIGKSTVTKYVSINPSLFVANAPSAQDAYVFGSIFKINSGGPVSVTAPVNLPHGAVITNVITYGSNASRQWIFYRQKMSDHAVTVGWGSTMNLADNSGATGTTVVDNSLYTYYIAVTDMATGESIYGAKITYTIQE